MRNLNFVFLGYISAPNGAATFFKNLIKNKNCFSKKNKVFFYYQKNKINESKLKKPKKFRNKIQQLGNKNSFFSFLVFYLFALRHAKRVIKQVKLKNNNDKWVFNDIFTAYYFLNKHPKTHFCYLILHNNGDPTRMIYQTYLKLKNSFFSKKIEIETKKTIKKFKKIIVLSNDSKEKLTSKYPDLKLENKIQVIENGNELPYIKKNVNNTKINGVSIGSISYRKGFDLLVEACNNIEINKFEIKCIGSIQDKEIVLKSKKNLNFLGPKPTSEIPQYLANADFFILCSRDEGMPISIIEAMQYRLPIFSTSVGSIPQMISDEVQGKLMDISVDSIKNCLEGIIKGRYKMYDMGNKSYQTYLERFSVSKMIKKYKIILDD